MLACTPIKHITCCTFVYQYNGKSLLTISNGGVGADKAKLPNHTHIIKKSKQNKQYPDFPGTDFSGRATDSQH